MTTIIQGRSGNFGLGWRAKIGLIIPAGGYAAEYEFHKMAPTGVGICTTRVPLAKVSAECFVNMLEDEEKAAIVLSQAKPNVIVLGCTLGSLIKGEGYDTEVTRRIEAAAKIPALPTATAVVQALKKLKLKKIVMVTPYSDELSELAKRFIEKHGFEVLRMRGLGAEDIPSVNPSDLYRAVKEMYTPDCDGIFISCTGLYTIDIIETIENDLGKPVISSNQASMWAALDKIQVKESINGFGRLLREP